MILKAFSIYDSKAKAFKQPFFELNAGTAIRAVSEVVNDRTHGFHKFSTDYTLFEIGEYDQNAGRLTSYDAHISHGLLDQFKEQIQSSIAETIGLKEH